MKIKKSEDIEECVSEKSQKILISELLQNSRNNEDKVELSVLWDKIYQRKWKVVLIATVFMSLTIVKVLMTPNQYKSEVLVAPVTDSSSGGLSPLIGKLGGLASFAGINIGKGEMSKPKLAIEIIRSREFIKKFIQKHNILVPLMASKKWSESKQELLIDENVFNVITEKWVRNVSPPKKIIPSYLEAHEIFLEILEIIKQKDSPLIKLSIEHYSPEIAKQWLDWLVEDINKHMRDLDQAEAKNSIVYLQNEIKLTQFSNMQIILSELIEEQMKVMMLANIREEYVFKIIDPAVMAEEKNSPRRGLIVVLFTLLGGLIGIISVLASRKS